MVDFDVGSQPVVVNPPSVCISDRIVCRVRSALAVAQWCRPRPGSRDHRGPLNVELIEPLALPEKTD